MSTNTMSPVAARSRRGRRLRVATVVAVGLTLAVPVSAGAATDQFLKLHGPEYKGESLAQGFVDAIEVESASFNIKRPRTASAPTFGNLTITKHVDRSSPALMLAAASGTVIPSARLSLRKAGGMTPAKPYLEYCFENVVVTSNQIDRVGGDEAPRETVAFSYLRVTQAYAKTLTDGTLASPIVAGWSLIENGPIAAFPLTCGGK